jgi:aspartate/methionine/tyrosine aminotransferase
VPCDVPPALGAFYYFLRVHTSMDALTMTERLIREHRVAVLPGPAFGASQGCHLRVAYGALDAQTAEEGINRLVSGVRGLTDL